MAGQTQEKYGDVCIVGDILNMKNEETNVEIKLKKYLADLKKRREELYLQVDFCTKHKMNEEARWLNKQSQILSDEYVEINNTVLGIYF